MDTELLSIVKNKLDFTSFCINYFETVKKDCDFYSIHNGEKLNLSIASDFYEDYVTSNLNFEEYQQQTTEQL